jgi:signal transduction histidine kinase
MKRDHASGGSTATAILEPSPERLIATSRLVLAAFGLVAIWLDPSQPAIHARATYAVLALYLVFAAAVAVAPVLAPPDFRAGIAVHLVDIVTLSALMHLTDGPTSPFFVFFTFALFSAALRWNWRGTLATALLLALIFITIGLLYGADGAAGQDLNRTIIRGGYLVVAAAILTYLGVIRDRDRQRLARLANWPPEAAVDSRCPPLQRPLAHAREILRAESALVLWEADDEPFQYRAFLSPAGYAVRRVAPMNRDQGIRADLARAPFHVVDARAGLYRSGQSRRLRRGRPLGSDLVAQYGIERAAVAPFGGDGFSGHLLLVGPRNPNEDLLPLTEIAAARICSEIQHHVLRRQLVGAAAMRERARLARDVHDGLLQALTAAALRIKTIAPEAPAALKPKLEELQRLVSCQQKRLRAFVEAVRQPAPASAGFHVGLEIGQVLSELGAQWGCCTKLEVAPADTTLPGPLGAELALMISEAAANSARHGKASMVRVEFAAQEAALRVRIHDDGGGLVGRDERPGQARSGARAGLPRSLQERVSELGGAMTLRSSETGVDLLIELPAP